MSLRALEAPKRLSGSPEQSLRQAPKRDRHFNKRIFLCVAAMAGEQLEFGTAEITSDQVKFNTFTFRTSQARSEKAKQSLRRGTTDSLAKDCHHL